MTTICIRLANQCEDLNCYGFIRQIAAISFQGAVCGYIYAKLADLPVAKVAKVIAIWNAAQTALINITITITNSITENKRARLLLPAISFITSSTVGLQELRKRGLLGDKMMYFLIIYRSVVVINSIASVLFKPQEQLKGWKETCKKLTDRF